MCQTEIQQTTSCIEAGRYNAHTGNSGRDRHLSRCERETRQILKGSKVNQLRKVTKKSIISFSIKVSTEEIQKKCKKKLKYLKL